MALAREGSSIVPDGLLRRIGFARLLGEEGPTGRVVASGRAARVAAHPSTVLLLAGRRVGRRLRPFGGPPEVTRYHPDVSDEETRQREGTVRSRVAELRPAWKGLGAYLVYQAIACVIYLPPNGAQIGTRYVGDGWADARLYQWALTWTPWALLHHRSPLVAPNIFVPDGANLAWVTFVPSLGIVSYPLQRIFGSLVTLNLLMLAAP